MKEHSKGGNLRGYYPKAHKGTKEIIGGKDIIEIKRCRWHYGKRHK